MKSPGIMRPAQWAGFLLAMCCTGPALAEDRALLIGVERYADPRIRTALGCEADAREMALLLKQGFDVKESQIRVLLSADATLQNIQAGLQDWLIGGTRPGDRVILYFSGHGSQARDDRGDGTIGLRPILCPHDYKPSPQANMLRSRVLREYLARLEGRNLTLIFDACHCGTAYKSIEGQAYSDPLYPTVNVIPKFIPPPPEVLAPVAEEAGGARTKSLPAPQSGSMIEDLSRNQVAFSACEDEQRAEIGMLFENGRVIWRSVFTHAFLLGLAGAADANRDATITNAEAIDFTRKWLEASGRSFTQTPRLHCIDLFSAQPVFGRTYTLGGPDRLIYVKGDEGAINRGAYHDIHVGDRFRIAPDGGSGAGASIAIDRLDAFVSFGKVSKDIRVVPPGLELRRMARLRPFQKLGVHLGRFADINGREIPAPEEVTQTLAAVPEARLVAKQEDCDRIVTGIVLQDGTLQLFMYGRFGRLLGQMAESRTAMRVKLSKWLKGQALLEMLVGLENPAPSFPIALSVNGGRTAYRVYPKDDPRQEKIEFHVKADRDCYLTLLSVDSQGQVTLLLPNQWHSEAKISGGQTYLVPPPNAEFVFTIREPAGSDTVKAIATLKPFDLRGVNFKGSGRPGFAAIDAGEANSVLEQVYTRGIGVEAADFQRLTAGQEMLTAVPTVDWATATITIQTLAP